MALSMNSAHLSGLMNIFSEYSNSSSFYISGFFLFDSDIIMDRIELYSRDLVPDISEPVAANYFVY